MRPLLSIPVCVFLVLSPVWPNAAEAQTPKPSTPIQHVVVIFDDSESFDHYFGIYPKATNPLPDYPLAGDPRFAALPNTPSVNGFSPGLLNRNPNLNLANASGQSNPFLLTRSPALSTVLNNSYGPEQASFDHGLMDLFPLNTRTGPPPSSNGLPVLPLTLGYYDGNTVTALWGYAQNFALNDNSYGTQFGPSSVGGINLISGQTNGINHSAVVNPNSSDEIADGQGGYTLIGDSDPLNDVCARTTKMQTNFPSGNVNVGNLLNSAGLTWGWFQGGFDLTVVNPNNTTGCRRSTVSPITGLTGSDYIPSNEPFQFYPSTANPAHTRPSSVAKIGTAGDAANHQYDTHDFFDALNAGNLANVSYLKPQSYQNSHPLDEQSFIVSAVNAVMQSPFWNTTAIIIAYADSGGWYDHQMGPIVNGSFTSADALTGAGACGTSGTTPQLPGPNSGSQSVNGRCGYGVRQPLLVISPWAKANYVDSTLTDQTSILRFIEDNWSLGRIGGGSFDALANPITNMFNFTNASGAPPNTNMPILSPTTGLPNN
jgi:phospholipase C